METEMEQDSKIEVTGFLKIVDLTANEVMFEGSNHINYENLSEALAYNLANKGDMFISEMHFGNGGTTVDQTGVITYLPTNTNNQNADLYNPTYYKIVDDTNPLNETTLNKVVVSHIPGKMYTDILITCFLDYNEPAGQSAFDNSQNLNGSFVFDEMGIKGYSSAGPGTGRLLTHVVFSPVEKSQNRLIQIDYTIRIQTLTSITCAA